MFCYDLIIEGIYTFEFFFFVPAAKVAVYIYLRLVTLSLQFVSAIIHNKYFIL